MTETNKMMLEMCLRYLHSDNPEKFEAMSQKPSLRGWLVGQIKKDYTNARYKTPPNKDINEAIQAYFERMKKPE